MDLIEQAVFTSAETDRSAGYQVVASSAGVRDADARELAVWSPSHDAMLDSTPDAVSINFHPLPSGAYCVSRTTPAGWEYSGRGVRVYTQCLIVPPAVLSRFANNPFAVVRAALAGGALRAYQEVPNRLEPLRLAGRAAAVDSTLLARLAANPGADWMASLIQAALNSMSIAIAGGPPAQQVIAGLINCLPPECRTEFPFSTGLRFSSRRPFRVVALSGDEDEQRRMKRLYSVTLLDLSDDPPPEWRPMDSWARLIQRVLKSGRTSLLAAQLSNRQMEIGVEDLHALGLQLLEESDTVEEEPGGPRLEVPTNAATPGAEAPNADRGGEDRSDSPASVRSGSPLPQSSVPPGELQRAHGAHRRFEREASSTAALKCKRTAPSVLLDPENPDVLEMLERLDDLVYEAIAGDTVAIEELRMFWPEVRRELGDEMLAESREQYLRYALSIWDECVDPDGVRHAWRAVQSLDVLCVLFDEV